MIEQLAEQELIDLFYADETAVSEIDYVPYGWQFPDENVSIPCQRGNQEVILACCLGITSSFIKAFPTQ